MYALSVAACEQILLLYLPVVSMRCPHSATEEMPCGSHSNCLCSEGTGFEGSTFTGFWAASDSPVDWESSFVRVSCHVTCRAGATVPLHALTVLRKHKVTRVLVGSTALIGRSCRWHCQSGSCSSSCGSASGSRSQAISHQACDSIHLLLSELRTVGHGCWSWSPTLGVRAVNA